jgi:hypothetical protein
MNRVTAPELPDNLSFENMQAYKAALRCYDHARIAAGEATPDQVQRENSVIASSKAVAILTFPELEKCHRAASPD